MERDGLPMAEQREQEQSSTAVVPLAMEEPPQDTEAFNRARCRFPFEVMFAFFATLLTCFVLAMHWELYLRIDQLATQALQLPANNNTFQVLAAYEANKIEFYDTICDAPYFAEQGYSYLQQNLVGLRDACLAFFILGLIPHYCFLIYRIGHLRELYYQRSRAAFSMWNPDLANPLSKEKHTTGSKSGNDPTGRVNVGKRGHDNNPLNGRVKVGDLSVPGQIRRSERVSLRGETSGYLAVQLLHEVPLVLIFFLFIAFVERYKGLECAECFSLGEICYVPSYFSTSMLYSADSALRWCMGATFFSVAWTYLTLCTRWFMYIHTIYPVWPIGKRFIAWLLATLTFLASFGLPIAILFTVYVGPTYYGYTDMTAAIGLSAVGGAIVLTGLMVFLMCAGMVVGESIFEALICCNFFTVCFWVCPCIDCTDETITLCSLGGPICCPCCCC